MGEATAEELTRRGWEVAVMSRKKVKKKYLSLQGDVAQDADCRRVAKAVLDKWGRIDALVNGAGTTKFVAHADLEGLSAEDILGILRVNLVGPFQMIRACAAALKAARGCVVNVGRRSARRRRRDRLADRGRAPRHRRDHLRRRRHAHRFAALSCRSHQTERVKIKCRE